jgi:hypothetical protein
MQQARNIKLTDRPNKRSLRVPVPSSRGSQGSYQHVRRMMKCKSQMNLLPPVWIGTYANLQPLVLLHVMFPNSKWMGCTFVLMSATSESPKKNTVRRLFNQIVHFGKVGTTTSHVGKPLLLHDGNFHCAFSNSFRRVYKGQQRLLFRALAGSARWS